MTRRTKIDVTVRQGARSRAASVRTIRVLYELDETGAWNASSPDVSGCFTHGRSLRQTRSRMRDAIATCVDVLGSRAEELGRKARFEEEIRLPAGLRAQIEQARALRDRVKALEREAMQTAAKAARAVTAAHVSLRDAGELLGLSHERVNQLLS